MIVSRLKDGDWTFGSGKADYISKSAAIRQNVLTRLKSFKYDWFLDAQAHIDYISLLGARNNRVAVLQEIERVVLNTLGVTRIIKLSSELKKDRKLKINIIFMTVYDTEINIEDAIDV